MTHKAKITYFFAILFLAVSAIATNIGFGNEKAKIEELKASKSPIDLSADHFTGNTNGWFTAQGNVLIRHENTQITADKISVNKTTGDIIAEGNVCLIREGEAAQRAEFLKYNFLNQAASSSHIDVRYGPLRVISDSASRNSDGSFEIDNVLVTTCTNHESALHYFVRGKHAFLMPEEYVTLDGATVTAFGVPFFYFPGWKRSFADHFGWRFDPGYESDWGAYLLTTYKTQLIDFDNATHDSIDSHTHLDYRTARGFALGEDISWHFGDKDTPENHIGYISGYAIRDDAPMDKDFDRSQDRDIVEENRYRASIRQDSYFTSRDYLTIRASLFSDSYLFEDFYEDEYMQLRQPENYASYNHTGDGWSGGIGIYHRLNNFYESINRLPDAYLDILNTQIGDSDLYYESETTGGYIQREFADYDNPSNNVPEAYGLARIDTRHALYLPEKLFGFLSVVPRAVYRGTYYGNTINTQTYEETIGTNTVVQTSTIEEGGKLRNLFELGFETSFKAYGIYDTKTDRYRHILEPYINYTYIPEPNIRPYELYQFDSVDKLDKENFLRIGLRQYLQKKRELKTVNLIGFDIFADYTLENENGESELSAIGFDGSFRPTDSILLDVDGTYDAVEGELNSANLWLALWNGERWEAAGNCFYRVDESTLLTGALAYNFSESWGFKLYSRFEAETSRLEKISAHIQYNLDCISFRLKGAYEPSFTRDDGSIRDAKVKIAFDAWIRAYAPTRYERRIHDGYLE